MADDGGLARLNNRLSAIPGKVKEAAIKAVMSQAKLMAKEMKEKAPAKTGKLRESIVVTGPDKSTPPYSQPGGQVVIPETTAAVTAGNKDVRYAHLVEYGTKKAKEQPFFWPTVRSRNPKARKAIKAAISREIKKNWGKK
nr:MULTISPECIES: HK97-gp10 family putative phage morphogenesis protein [unclassified Ochrobactrum]